jgi:hypothetical protein
MDKKDEIFRNLPIFLVFFSKWRHVGSFFYCFFYFVYCVFTLLSRFFKPEVNRMKTDSSLLIEAMWSPDGPLTGRERCSFRGDDVTWRHLFCHTSTRRHGFQYWKCCRIFDSSNGYTGLHWRTGHRFRNWPITTKSEIHGTLKPEVLRDSVVEFLLYGPERCSDPGRMGSSNLYPHVITSVPCGLW